MKKTQTVRYYNTTKYSGSKFVTTRTTASVSRIANLRKECHNSKFGIFELLVHKETFADALLTGTVS
jgi:hypothetical protein